jgi:hypothetical protein
MARFRCRACGSEGIFAYCGKHKSPNCGSDKVPFASSIEEPGT